MKKNLPTSFTLSAVAMICAGLTLSSVANANTLTGQVSSVSQKSHFQGAKVVIKELDRALISERDGRFTATNLPAGNYTLEISYLGAETVTKSITITDNQVTDVQVQLGSQSGQMDDIIVVGQRAGQAGALNRQKNALSLKSIVSADSIGQLPDQNAAEALQRLPGLSIQRDQGEGRFVAIRGIDPNLNNVTINGANVPSPEAGVRSVAMDVIPSELVQSLEVSKTVTPDMDASAVGGSIEVKSLSAFDREGQSYSVTLQASHNEQVSETSPKASFSFTDIYAAGKELEVGVATAVSWFEREFGSHNMETDGGWMELEMDDVNSGEEVSFFGAEEMEQRHYRITRERLGAALNLDVHHKGFNKYYLRTLYSKFSDDEFRQRNEYKFDKGDLFADELSQNAAYFSGAEMDRDTKDRYEEQSILSVVLGGENLVQDWFIEYSIGYSKSDESEPNRLDTSFAGEDFALGYVLDGKTPTLAADEASKKLSNFEIDEIVWENNLSEDENTSFRLDLTKDFTLLGHNAQIKFGGKYADREKFNRVDAKLYDGGFDDLTAKDFAANEPEYELGAFGPGLSRGQIRDYFYSNRSALELNQLETDIETQGRSYTSEETVTALYAMLTVDIDKLNVIAGFRYEDTDYATSGNRVELINDEVNDVERVEINQWQVEDSYDHLLPNLTLRYEISDKLITRFAYTQTLARPSFEDAAAFQIIETETTEDDGEIEIERKAEVGNPDLDPYKSTNYDFSVEYYPGAIGVLSAGVFHKNIDNFIAKAEVQDNGQWQGYKEVIQSVNGGAAELTGVELAYTKNFQNGLMLSVNGTFIDADDNLPNQSDTVGNLMFGYENSQISARLSASYKSKSFLFEENKQRVFQDDHLQLDFSMKYFYTEQTQLYFNAINLTDEPMSIYQGDTRYNYQYETYGRSFELGVTVTSF
ncbi:TonB-dependent receptor [Pseudoalteromonas sp. GCY]|uniref:TonB-dependent receptor n=1 Tax=Pseudoalteromonas sp. GCY TaxID=2003316 RepID=UPI000BFF1445|nr:TonB-dependent receptor [Pseudoalteromonas sp. GCY]PHI35598.1 TonB-dependent receptor [Pseudoalteromonas sp. GCY]QQQ64615.1 TonB-dependent receptor [Pseudoalteromonas sp. GCY]